jgi:hypothetical protein
MVGANLSHNILAMSAQKAPAGHAGLLRLIHDHLRPATYVEIGVGQGHSFFRALPETLAIGIDPNPRMEAPQGHRIFRLTSDDFFATHDLREELGGRPVDVAFIDGWHHFEFALRDFTNLERYCDPGSVILIHDCYPIDAETSIRDPYKGIPLWNGDVWKLILALKKYRPDLRVSVVDCPPTGVGIVTGLDASSNVLADRYDEIFDEFIDLDYSFLDDGKEEKLNRVSNDWELVKTLLPSANE